ncbi:hypothetical protein ACIREE_42150 [Streptomyces sp. NPDC102467]|uniref:hypothetical protein n=1 Tax=Streptomyces sp. NPDC102467 TaxID=3366179 RepID=UPI0038122D81
MGQHPPHRARIVFYDVALEQVNAMAPAELARLDVVLRVIAALPTVGTSTKRGSARQYEMGPVRVLYVRTALGTLVLVAHVEA